MSSTPVPAGEFNAARLVDAARRGSHEAFEQLVAQFDRTVQRLALQVTGNPADAEEVRQETFLKAYRHLDTFLDHASFAAWVVSIARNESVTVLRRRHANRVVSLDDTGRSGEDAPQTRQFAITRDDPERRYASAERRRLLAQALEDLDPLFRNVCLMRDVEDRSTEETADQLGLSKGAVRTRLFRGRLKLRERLRSFLSPSRSGGDGRQGSPRRRRAPGPALPSMACGD